MTDFVDSDAASLCLRHLDHHWQAEEENARRYSTRTQQFITFTTAVLGAVLTAALTVLPRATQGVYVGNADPWGSSMIFVASGLTIGSSSCLLFSIYTLLLKPRDGRMPEKESLQEVSSDGGLELTMATEALSLSLERLEPLEEQLSEEAYELLSLRYSATEALQTLNLLRRSRLRMAEKSATIGIICAALAVTTYIVLAMAFFA